MNDNNLIRCSQISVDCVANDPVDVRSGGPIFLGFDFYVKQNQTEEMKKFIDSTLKEFDVPLIDMYVSDTIDINEKDIWTKDKILKSISGEAEYLRSEAARKYNSSLKK